MSTSDGAVKADPRRSGDGPPKTAFINDPRVRAMLFQLLLVGVVLWLIITALMNVYTNLQKQNIASGYDFLGIAAGFDISQKLIEYSQAATFGRAFMVGLVNTLLVAALGVVFATIFGFLLGVARLSRNWVIAKLAYWYVEIIRNLPLLFQIIFWYMVLTNALPGPRDSLTIGSVYLNNRGLIMPKPIFADNAWMVLAAVLVGIVASIVMRRWARARQEATGQQFPIVATAIGLIIGMPIVVYILSYLGGGSPISFEYPEKGTFRLTGGLSVLPEFIALLVALTAYTSAFIAEIVRAGILAVSHGQTEAGRSLGLSEGRILSLIVVPQALRVIIPPLTSQYLNIAKNSSLATGIGYPDVVAVGGTIINQTGRAIEVISLWMLCYLTISVITSVFMNWYNKRIALVER